jgi:hypothetical protein
MRQENDEGHQTRSRRRTKFFDRTHQRSSSSDRLSSQEDEKNPQGFFDFLLYIGGAFITDLGYTENKRSV